MPRVTWKDLVDAECDPAICDPFFAFTKGTGVLVYSSWTPDHQSDFIHSGLGRYIGFFWAKNLLPPLPMTQPLPKDMSHWDLREAVFRHLDLENDTSFEGANLEGALFIHVSNGGRGNINFSSVKLKNSVFKFCSFFFVNLVGANVQDTTFSSVSCEHLRASDSTFIFVTFERCFFDMSRFPRASFTSCCWDKVFAPRCDFTGSTSVKTQWDHCNIHHAIFEEAKLEGNVLEQTDLSCSNFRAAKFQRVQFSTADLHGANMFGTTFSSQGKSFFTDCNLIAVKHLDFQPQIEFVKCRFG